MRTAKPYRSLFAVLALGFFLSGAFGLAVGPGDLGEAGTPATPERVGPAAALAFARQYRGDTFTPKVLYCYPEAKGIPFADTEHIIPMTESLWTPAQLSADFQRRMAGVPPSERKQGIIVLLKTERCAPKALRACSVTTAALEKRSTPLAERFLIYGVLLKPRDGDIPAGTLKIETGPDAWKNAAAGEYEFKQGPGATLAFLNPADGTKLAIANALTLRLTEEEFTRDAGRTPTLHAKLQEILDKLGSRQAASREMRAAL